MLKLFGVFRSDFILVSDITFAVVLHVFGEARPYEGKRWKNRPNLYQICRSSYAVLKIRQDKPMV